MTLKTSEQISSFLSFLTDSVQAYQMASADESEANDMTMDILHSIELDEHSYHELAKIGRGLRSVRQKRRSAKDTISQLEPVVAWAEENQPVIKGLERLLGEVRKQERRLDTRSYTPRTDWKEEFGVG